MPLLEGKKALIFGIANHRSIGWAIAQALAAEGAQLAFSYQQRMEKYVRDLAAKLPGTTVMECDVQNDQQLDAAFAQVGETFGGELDILIHSVAFAPPSELENPFAETTREGFHTALDISAYSLIALAQRAKPLMQAHNIRVNAISAGPLNTLAARGITGFTGFRDQMTSIAPLRRNIEQSDVGDTALFLCSPLARSITGDIIFVDAGYHIMGALQAPSGTPG